MENLFVPYKLAIKLKENGFNEKCFAHYNQNGVFFWKILCVGEEVDYTASVKDIIDFEHNPGYIQAPLNQQVLNWLMEKHGLFINNSLDETLSHVWKITPLHPRASYQQQIYSKHVFSSYSDCLNNAIEEILKLI